MRELIELFVEDGGHGDLNLHFGDPRSEPVLPTMREWLESHSCDPDDDASLWEFLFEWGYCDEDEIRVHKAEGKSPGDLISPLDQPIDPDGSEAMNWFENEFESRESPMAVAFHQLTELRARESVPKLEFIDGDRPGSNLTLVRAPDKETVEQLVALLKREGFEVRQEYFSW